ncbi:GIY-YIG nuclease family protein [Streptomyces albipurpureus]|uniref:GIY-YIG nuclease family protein n=1 Tax=Streptomyces albipurpureus TaxID=2897419 RepID=A0ABT0UNI6_9ACTN|nr:GIY-YIG nuclease family protein [Streptomyces sp. CWNU-1]MCM2390177.1 GIY-YIG nuclease family protein [Streptomyces sp. CWNU-1]
MPEPTVRCACGRTMTPDAPRGRGSYRCGCGNRVHVSIPILRGSQCVGTHLGEACRLPPAISEPLPLCDDHFTSTGLRRYASWWKLPDDELAHLIAIERTRIGLQSLGADSQMHLDHWTSEMAEQERLLQHLRTPQGRREAREQADREAHGSVYFVQSGTAVKIGKSINVPQRLREINAPEIELLATEPGYTRREHELHQAHAPYRLNGEWFRLAPPLAIYINGLRTAQGLPPIPTNIDNATPTL